jgi:hypothetical protein
VAISIVASEETRETYVRNILAAWHAASPEQEARGRHWYQTAHELADMISDGHTRQGAGVLAALSANKRWAQNRKLAHDAFQLTPHGHTRDTLAKVEAIIEGGDPEDVLPMTLKTGHFFRCIADPSDPDAVVIDRHAHDVAVGEIYGSQDRGLSSARRYALLAHCYREAALRLGELPSTVQAVTWIRQTEYLSGMGSRIRLEGEQ